MLHVNLQMNGSVEAAKEYRSQYPASPAEEYLTARGLAESIRWAPGYVRSAITGQEKYRDHIAIPYLRPAGGEHQVATVRFRCIRDEHVRDEDGVYFFLKGIKEQHGEWCQKYMSLPGDKPRLYNTQALIGPSPYIAIAEGEFSSWAVELDGIPAVGTQGVSAWREHFDTAFAGYDKVFILGDGDDPGRQMTEKLAERLPNGVPISLPDGEDPDSLRRECGDGIIRQLCGLEE